MDLMTAKLDKKIKTVKDKLTDKMTEMTGSISVINTRSLQIENSVNNIGGI